MPTLNDNQTPSATILPPLVPAGIEARVNSAIGGTQQSASVAVLDDGYVVVWQSEDGVYAQRYDSAGVSLGDQALVVAAADAAPVVAAVGNGFVVTWSADAGGGIAAIFVQRFDASGAAEGARQQVTAPSAWDRLDPGITVLADGGYLVTWNATFSGDGGSGSDVAARRYTSAGAAVGGEEIVSGVAGDLQAIATAGLADGSYVVAWSVQVGEAGTIFIQRYDAAGVPLGGAQGVSSGFYASNPVLTALDDGGFVVAWDGLGAGDDGDVFLRRFDSSGTATGDETTIPARGGNQYSPSIAALADGGFVVAYVGGSDDDYPGIFAQRYSASGAPMDGQVLINTTAAGVQARPSIAALGDGYVVAWEGNGSGDAAGVFARQVEPGDLTATEQVAINLKHGLQIADADAGSSVVTAMLAADYGVLHVEAGTSGASVTGSDSGEVTITGTVAQINALFDGDATSVVTYVANTDTPPASTQLTLTVDDGGNSGAGEALTATGSVTVAITAVDDPPVARNDGFGTMDTDPVSGNLFANHGQGTDYDPDDPIAVVTVNGLAANVGAQITLPSGALITVNADGTFVYDPNGAFEYVPSYASGAWLFNDFDTVTYSLGGNTATAYFLIAGVDNDDVVRGSDGNDTLDGGIGTNTLSYVDARWGVFANIGTTGPYDTAGAGIDTVSNFQNLTGSNYADELRGSAGANVLDGGMGADVMLGGAGDDIYVVEHAGDSVREKVGRGTDTVRSSVSYALPTEVEHLVLMGTGAINGSGNLYANSITGNDAANKLAGYAGNDRLDGGMGADLLAGGEGNDVLVVDNPGDNIKEKAGEGTDTVEAWISFTLPGTEVENLALMGSAAIDATGNTLANTIAGNSAANALFGMAGDDALLGGGGADQLRGGAGRDTLTGGAGADCFYFDADLNAETNVDTITDFELGTDLIYLRRALFGGPAGQLSADAFHIGSAAHDASDRIIYDSTTGALYFDPDGSGVAAAIHFAMLDSGLRLIAADFVVF